MGAVAAGALALTVLVPAPASATPPAAAVPGARTPGPSIASTTGSRPVARPQARSVATPWTHPDAGLHTRPVAARAATSLRRCGRVDVPNTQAVARVSLRGTALACSTVRRIVRTAYGRSVLLGDTRTFTVRDGGRAFRCRYAPTTGGMVCTGPGRRLRGTI